MNNTSLAIMQPQELDTIQRTARLLAVSEYFDGKGDNHKAIAMIATKILAGREMGFGPFASVNGVHIISGKPTIGANLMASAVKGSGRYDYRVKEMTATVCKLEFFQRNGDKLESLGVSEFTIADATTAGLMTNGTWKKFPKNMLFARALSNGVRWHCPDVFSGNTVYVPEELGADVDGDGNVVEATYSVTKPPVEPERIVDTSTGEIVQQQASAAAPPVGVDGDVLFTPEQPDKHESPPHQRLFGQLTSGFGPDADDVRPWLINKWTSKMTPDNTRNSATELSDDEKSLLGDYIKEHLTTLQRVWNKRKAEQAQAQQPAMAVAK